MGRRLLSLVFVPLLLIISTVVVVFFARGWRFDIKEKSLAPTGILVATSDPDGAQVFVNNKFTAATNSNINLEPNWYDVTISKDGYFNWTRKIRIQGEVVVKTDAILFSKNPSLSPLTSTGVLDPVLSPDGSKVAYIASPSAVINSGLNTFEEQLTKPTLFIYDFTSRNLPFSKNPQPYQGTRTQLLFEWDKEAKLAREVTLRKMPAVFVKMATNSAQLLSFSPDETKVLYEATASATLERSIVPPLIGSRESEEDRALERGKLYVYDAKEDRNYNISSFVGPVILDTVSKQLNPMPAVKVKTLATPTPTPITITQPIFWLGTSAHLVLVENKTISVMEYEGSNKVTVYSGPFMNGFVFPHPSGHQLIIMTNLNPEVSNAASLYTLNIR